MSHGPNIFLVTSYYLSLLITFPAYSQPLAAAVEAALKTNPEILIATDRRLVTEEQLNEAKSGYLPKLDLNLGGGRERSQNVSTRPGSNSLWRREAGLTLSQMLYDGAGTRSEVDRQQARVKSAALNLVATTEQIALGTVEAYLDVLRQHEKVELASDNLAAHQRTFEQIKRRIENGVSRQADLGQTKARLALAQASTIASESELMNATSAFIKIVGDYPVNLIRPAVEMQLPFTLEEALTIAADNHPALRSARSDIEIAQALTRVAESAMLPRVDLELGSSWNDNQNGVAYKNNDTFAMLRMRYNLFRGNADTAKITESRLQTELATNEASRVLRQVENSVRLSWNSLQATDERLPKLKERSDEAKLTRDHYIRQFSAGQRTLLDLLDSENELFSARSDYVDAVYVGIFARHRLLADMGRLLYSFGVVPREESNLAGTDIKALKSDIKP